MGIGEGVDKICDRGEMEVEMFRGVDCEKRGGVEVMRVGREREEEEGRESVLMGGGSLSSA